MGLQTTARGPNTPSEDILSIINEKTILIYETFVDLVECSKSWSSHLT